MQDESGHVLSPGFLLRLRRKDRKDSLEALDKYQVLRSVFDRPSADRDNSQGFRSDRHLGRLARDRVDHKESAADRSGDRKANYFDANECIGPCSCEFQDNRYSF
jgi:hypothetical protein